MTTFFAVRSSYRGEDFIHEVALSPVTRTDLVEEIAQGQYDTGQISAIYCVETPSDLATPGRVTDVSRAVAEDLSTKSFRDGPISRSATAFVEEFGLLVYREPSDTSLITDTMQIRRRAA